MKQNEIEYLLATVRKDRFNTLALAYAANATPEEKKWYMTQVKCLDNIISKLEEMKENTMKIHDAALEEKC